MMRRPLREHGRPWMGGRSSSVQHPPESPSQPLPCKQLPLPCPTPEVELWGSLSRFPRGLPLLVSRTPAGASESHRLFHHEFVLGSRGVTRSNNKMQARCAPPPTPHKQIGCLPKKAGSAHLC